MSPATSAAWIAMGVVLTTATQLRAPGLPVGMGEVLLVLWMAYACLHALWSRDQVFARDGFAACAGAFWLLSLCLLGMGMLLSTASRLTVETGAMHDLAALSFCAALTILVPLSLRTGPRPLAARLTALIGVMTLLLLIGALTLRRLGPLELWYGVIRFRGWSENPNQMALLVVGAPFLALQLASDATERSHKLGWTLVVASTVAAGVATLSDALAVAWVMSFGIYVAIAWMRGMRAPAAPQWGTLLRGVLLPLTLAFALVPLFGPLLHAAEDMLLSIYSYKGQGSSRVTIWLHAIEAISQSPVFGWGPGAHAGNTGAHEGFEAHNTFIDWSASTGLVGLLAYLLLMATAAFKALRSGKLPLFMGVASLSLFSTFHFVLRHPMFWMYLLVFYEYSRASGERATTSNQVTVQCAV